jgi:DNA-binding NtrC family response regulator
MRLLIIGPLGGYVSAAGSTALKAGAEVIQAESIDGGLTLIRSGKGVDLVFADVGLNVPALMVSLRSERIAIPVIACGVEHDTQRAVAAINAGAKEYLPLPPDTDLIAALIKSVTQEDGSVLAVDPKMTSVIAMANRIAPSDANVLIAGESGTGKEVIARHLHRKSKRKDNRFVAVNCAAIPEALLESELFGHEKGAFTGAVSRRIGRFEEADQGTILLDEISEMDAKLQAKLLRVIQEREVDRVGSNKPVSVNVRILATTNRDLEEEIRLGRFRQDLYFRLNVVCLHLPPLRERPADILVLARHFAQRFATENNLSSLRMSADAERAIAAHPWPGNVRELENTMHRAVLLSDGDKIDAEALSFNGGQNTAASQPNIDDDAMNDSLETASFIGRTVADVERELIIDTLQHCYGNRTHAAGILGISIRTLRNKLRQYGDDGFSVPVAGQLPTA